MDSLLTKLADELLVQDITEPSAVLGSLSDHELQAAYDDVLEQFALELLIGADQNSARSDGKLVIDANHGPIHLLQAAFYALRLEVQRRPRSFARYEISTFPRVVNCLNMSLLSHAGQSIVRWLESCHLSST
jgi:hypothetical protein